jgi:PAS domain S-box-containing protein
VACLKGIAPTYRAEERVRWPDGSEHWLETHGRGTYQADGRACRVAGVVKDITDRKRAEQVLQASEERFRRLIEEAPVAIGMSRDEFVLYANPAFVALFGYGQAADVVGRRVLDLVAPQQHAEFAQRSRARADGLPAASLYELTLQRRDGSELQSLLAVTRVALHEGPAMPLQGKRTPTGARRLATDLRWPPAASVSRSRGPAWVTRPAKLSL